MRLLLLILLAALAVPAVLLAAPRDDEPEPPSVIVPTPTPSPLPPIATPVPTPPPAAGLPPVAKPSQSLGRPWAGRLVDGRRLPPQGKGFLTWDPILKRVGNRPWRRWGSDRLLRTVRSVLAAYARRHPDAPPVLVGDLSRRHGGDFGPRFGGVGHISHQNGLDADVYYPRTDGRLRSPRRPEQVDRAAAQELVDAFVAKGAVNVFVGPSLALRGPKKIVSPLVNHDDHLHVRLRARGR